MTYPTVHAERHPTKPAVVVADTGESISYRELDENSLRLSQLLWASGLRPGDHVAVLMGSHLRFLELYWAAMRSGLYFTPVSTHLTAAEAGYIVESCSARALIADARHAEVAAEIGALPGLDVRLGVGGPIAGFDDYGSELSRWEARALPEEPLGATMPYSSGSTGRPKGVRRPLSGRTVQEGHPTFLTWMREHYGGSGDMVLLSPAPLYHAAPLSFTSTVLALGGTVVLMERFDAGRCLRAIESHHVTHGLFVPTMFVRMLRLPDAEREAADVSSLEVVIHGAGPCSVSVKRAMIEWFGPILVEYYAASEDNGTTLITSEEWLARPGSVGRAAAGSTLHVCDEQGAEVPPGVDGLVYFESGSGKSEFEYAGEPERTAATRHPEHPDWTTLGDVGHVDPDGYLFLTDRRDDLIITGGVNVSPQEVESVLIEHPSVLDVVALGLPDEEYGQRVAALVQPVSGADRVGLPDDLHHYVRERLAGPKRPREIHLVDELPRSPTGKLNKQRLKQQFVRSGTVHG